MNQKNEMKSPLIFDSNLSFCSLISIGGAAVVTKGAGLQGIAWWFLLMLVLGTLIQEKHNRNRDRILKSCVVSLFFIISASCIFVLYGVGLSGFSPEGVNVGIDFAKIPDRLSLLLEPFIGGSFLVVGVLSALAIWMANVAKSQTLNYLIEFRRVPDDAVNSLALKYKALAGGISGLAALIAYFAL